MSAALTEPLVDRGSIISAYCPPSSDRGRPVVAVPSVPLVCWSDDRGSAIPLRQLVQCVEFGSSALGSRSRFNAGRMQLVVTDDSLIVFVPNHRATHSTGFHLQHRTSAVSRRIIDPVPQTM